MLVTLACPSRYSQSPAGLHGKSGAARLSSPSYSTYPKLLLQKYYNMHDVLEVWADDSIASNLGQVTQGLQNYELKSGQVCSLRDVLTS